MNILKGSSIIEVVIATALISIAILSALSLTNNSQKTNDSARNLEEANKYATQATDWLRSERDSLGWATMAAKTPGTYCLNNLPIPPANFGDITLGDCMATDFLGDNTIFQRKIVINTTNADKTAGVVKILVQVTWLEKIMRETSIEMELTKWN